MSVCCICCTNYIDCIGDGHGGREVARFVENWLPKEAQRLGNASDLEGTLTLLYNRYEL